MMYREHRYSARLDEPAFAGSARASTVVRAEDLEFRPVRRKPAKNLRCTDLFEALDGIKTLPRLKPVQRRRRRSASHKAAASSAALSAHRRIWRWMREYLLG